MGTEIKLPIAPDVDEAECYDAGYSSIDDGPDESNCHCKFFTTPNRTAAWERGRNKAVGELLQENRLVQNQAE